MSPVSFLSLSLIRLTGEWRESVSEQIQSIKSSWPQLEADGSTFFALDRLLELKNIENELQICSDCACIKIHLPSPKRLFHEIFGFYVPLLRLRTECNECSIYNNLKQGDAISLLLTVTDENGPSLSLTHCLETIRFLTGKVYCPNCRLSDEDEHHCKWIIFIGLKSVCVQIVQTLIWCYFLSMFYR